MAAREITALMKNQARKWLITPEGLSTIEAVVGIDWRWQVDVPFPHLLDRVE